MSWEGNEEAQSMNRLRNLYALVFVALVALTVSGCYPFGIDWSK